MATSNCDNAINYKSTDSQKECCAVIAMREAVETLAAREKISYEEALLRFTSSRAYEALFDFDTEIWKEGSDYKLVLDNEDFTMTHYVSDILEKLHIDKRDKIKDFVNQ